MLWLYDEESLLSLRSTATRQDLSTVTAEFSFDPELMTSKVYRTAMRTHMIFAIGGGKGNRAGEPVDAFRVSRRFSIHSTRLSDMEDGQSIVSTLLDRGSVSSRANILPPRQVQVQVQGRPRLDDSHSLRSSLSAHSVANISLRRFWHQRKPSSDPSKPLLTAPSSAPKDGINVVVFGIDGSGKSTLVKSLTYAFGGYDIRTRRSYIEDISREAVNAMLVLTRELAQSATKPGLAPPGPVFCNNSGYDLSRELEFLEKSHGLDDFHTSPMNPAVAKALSALWAQPELQAVLANLRGQDDLSGSTE